MSYCMIFLLGAQIGEKISEGQKIVLVATSEGMNDYCR